MNSHARSDLDYRTFGTALRDLLIERKITTKLGNPDWTAFAKRLRGISYETLRKAVTGERPVAPKILETSAKVLGIEPTLFGEYRLWKLRQTLDPAAVGAETALQNLARWESRSSL
jgi:hypothetical protein